MLQASEGRVWSSEACVHIDMFALLQKRASLVAPHEACVLVHQP